MSQVNSPLEIYKVLPKSNCRKCEMRTCMAFADAVLKGKKGLHQCPYLENSIIEQFEGKISNRSLRIEQQQEQMMEHLKAEVAAIDFASSAERLGASYSNGNLIINALGKDFIVDAKGNITSECHVITWLTVPLLNYIKQCQGKDPAGKWIPFRELPNGRARQPLFGQRCEKPLQKIADTHMDLLFDKVVYIFGGKYVETNFASDISLVLHPLPKVPMLISYSKPEENLSRLNIFFDTYTENNLDAESIQMLCTGLATMFEKIAFRHG
ncbi:MAG: DUF3786 domain-containing protein [Firmicutes bacterium]|nr:DUF3786 domain-containing protein [Bacillota bacterium]